MAVLEILPGVGVEDGAAGVCRRRGSGGVVLLELLCVGGRSGTELISLLACGSFGSGDGGGMGWGVEAVAPPHPRKYRFVGCFGGLRLRRTVLGAELVPEGWGGCCSWVCCRMGWGVVAAAPLHPRERGVIGVERAVRVGWEVWLLRPVSGLLNGVRWDYVWLGWGVRDGTPPHPRKWVVVSAAADEWSLLGVRVIL